MSQSNIRRVELVHRSSGDEARRQRLGPYLIESLIEPDEEGVGTVYLVTIAPGQRTGISFHQLAEEYYFILAGVGVAVLDGEEHSIRPGDFLRLPPGTRHGFITGDGPLELLNIHTPGCRPERDTYFVDGAAPEAAGAGTTGKRA